MGSRRMQAFAVVVLLLSGCVQSNQLERLGLITAVGYDMEERKLKGTYVIQQFDPTKQDVTQVLVNKAYTSKGVREATNLEMSNQVVAGQLRVILYGKEVAQKGLVPFLDSLSRDASIGTMVYVAISEDSAKSILMTKPKVSNIGRYLYELIENNIKGELLLSSTLHEFLQAYYDPGQDPIIPMFQKKGGTVEVKKLALMRGDQMMGTLRAREGFYIKMIKDRFKNGSIELAIKTDELKKSMFEKKPREEVVYITVDDIKSSSDIKLIDAKSLTYELNIQADVRVLEMSEPVKVGDPKVIKDLEKALGKEMENELTILLEKLQDVNSDPIGFGTIYDAKVRGVTLTEEEWHKKFPGASFKVNVKTNILRTGVMD